MNKNAIKTAIMFLGIIFFVLMGRMFFDGNELLVTSTDETQFANSSCAKDSTFC
jgi:hypothetical protein